jgi:uncharacterized protein
LAIFTEMESAIIAFSGGVDSALLAKAAVEALGERALAVTADSPSLPRRELRQAQELAEMIGIRQLVVQTHELEDERYADNPANRCFYCKSELFDHIDGLAGSLGYRWVCYGENLDDQGDHRPGAAAAAEHKVRAPLKEAGLGKAEIRALAQHLNLPVWDKPAAACLASRFPYGTHITAEKLAQVEAAEELLWSLGFRQYRVRHHGEIARIEVGQEERARLLEHSDQVVGELRSLGYRYVTMDLSGYQRGSLNLGLSEAQSATAGAELIPPGSVLTSNPVQQQRVK